MLTLLTCRECSPATDKHYQAIIHQVSASQTLCQQTGQGGCEMVSMCACVQGNTGNQGELRLSPYDIYSYQRRK